MKRWSPEKVGIGLLGAVLACATGCFPKQDVVDVKTAEGTTRRVIRIVESIEAAAGTKIVQADETRPEQAPYASLFDAFAILAPLVCTATHLGNGVVITAGHCFEEKPADGVPNYARVLDDDGCLARVDGFQEKVTMRWGYRYGHKPYLKSECARVVAREWTIERDFAVMLIAPNQGQLPRATVEPELADPVKGSDITMFSHPNTASLRWSGVCKLGQPDSETLPYFLHRCSTDGGSSGAAVIDTTTRKVVGIHLGEQDLAPEGSAPPKKSGTNYAIALSDPVIFTHIRRAFAQAAGREPEGLPPSVNRAAKAR